MANINKSETSGNKLAIHESSRPQVEGKFFHTVWAGKGDDMATPAIGEGPGLAIVTAVDTPESAVDIEFHPDFGDVYLHEGYFQWENAGWGDCLCVSVVAKATPLQTSVNLDYEMDGNKIKVATGGPGTGTHGLNGNPVFVPSYDTTGYWDLVNGSPVYSAGQTGAYDWLDIEEIANEFVRYVPMYNSSSNYIMLQSADTVQVPPGYVVRVKACNVSNTVWRVWMIMTLYREKTVDVTH